MAELDGFRHTFWVIDDENTIRRITEIFAEIPSFYIADGQHRSAAAALGSRKRLQNPNHTGDEEYNYFMAVCFPDNQLNIIDYNRLVTDLNGLYWPRLLWKLEENFIVEEKELRFTSRTSCTTFPLPFRQGTTDRQRRNIRRQRPHRRAGRNNCFQPDFGWDIGIKDLRSDKRVDFVGGIRGLGELKRRG